MIKCNTTAKRLMEILFGVLLVVSMTFVECEANQKKSPLNTEAFRKILRQYTTGTLADYTVVRQDKLVSFQQSLLAKPDISPFKTEEAKRMGMGLFSTDGFYCLAYGNTAEAVKYYDVYYRLLRELPLRDLADIDTKPSSSMEAFLKNPSKTTDAELDKIVREIDKKVITNLEKLAATPEGIQFAIDFFYAVEIESLYLVSQTVIQSDGKSQGAIATLAVAENDIRFIEKLLATVERDVIQKKTFKVSEKKAVLSPVMKILKKKAGKLGKSDAVAILKIVSPERKRIVNGGIIGNGAK